MVEVAVRWLTMGGTYLEVLGCLGTALVVLLGGVMDFSTVDAFEMFLETGLTLVPMNVKGLEGTEALRCPRFSIALAAFETSRHMPDFRSSMSCLGFR